MVDVDFVTRQGLGRWATGDPSIGVEGGAVTGAVEGPVGVESKQAAQVGAPGREGIEAGLVVDEEESMSGQVSGGVTWEVAQGAEGARGRVGRWERCCQPKAGQAKGGGSAADAKEADAAEKVAPLEGRVRGMVVVAWGLWHGGHRG